MKIEFSFTQPRLEPVLKPVSSFVADFMGQPAEAEISCLSPVETAADKLSALTWRVLRRNRAADHDDPAMIRHLHDLCALRSVIEDEKELFIQTSLDSFEGDQQSGQNRQIEQSFPDSLGAALKTIKNDKGYRDEYKRFVDAMSYADEDERIGFDDALSHLEEVVSNF